MNRKEMIDFLEEVHCDVQELRMACEDAREAVISGQEKLHTDLFNIELKVCDRKEALIEEGQAEEVRNGKVVIE